MILLSLASKQIWPHVLTAAHLKPARLFLLHTEDTSESSDPARRLKRFFDNGDLVPKGNTRLERIPHDDFTAIERALDDLQTSQKLSLSECCLNFTGGNKLMATAAFRWATRRGLSSLYLERGNRLTRFSPRDGDVHTSTEPIDGHLADNLDPVSLLTCQLGASEMERRGQCLTLNPTGKQLPQADFFRRITNDADPGAFLHIGGTADRRENVGDRLEFQTAAVLLKLGVTRVQRSLRLKVRTEQSPASPKPHAEVDLLFTWNGRLWLVDCKDRKPVEDLTDRLHRLLPPLNGEAQELFDRCRKELSISPMKVMKEDLMAVNEAGGLLGQVVCVRKSDPPEEAVQYARHNRIELVRKSNLVSDLRNLLHPSRPADGADLAGLAGHFSPVRSSAS